MRKMVAESVSRCCAMGRGGKWEKRKKREKPFPHFVFRKRAVSVN